MTPIEKLRTLAESLLDDNAPREQRLAKLTKALTAAYKIGLFEARAEREVEEINN